ncbi:MAG: hypothetical protein LQ349_001103 [Xanthoria aureola]|nr:MAG: hypothetical protein LQ349_001103 [Xanthoria aureola]
MDEETWGLGSERGAAVDEQFVRLMTHHHHNMLCSRDEEMVAQSVTFPLCCDSIHLQSRIPSTPLTARLMAPPGWLSGEAMDNLGLKEAPPRAAKYEMNTQANELTEQGGRRQQEKEHIKTTSAQRVAKNQPEKVKARKTARAEMRAKKQVTDRPGVYNRCMTAYVETLRRDAPIRPQCDECKRSETDCIKPKINQVFPPTEATSRKPYQSSKPSSHADPTIISLERHKDDEGSSRKDAATSLEDGSPRQSYISDAEAPRKKRKLSHIRDQGHSATGNSDNNSSGTGNLDGAPGGK